MRWLCLVIEDDEDIRDLLTLILTQDGFEVRAVETGTEGLSIAAGATPLALVTLDRGLPDMDGRDVARSVRTLTAAPILMITAFAESSDELDGMAAGASAYLAKPFRPAQLRAFVRELCPQRLSACGEEPPAVPLREEPPHCHPHQDGSCEADLNGQGAGSAG